MWKIVINWYFNDDKLYLRCLLRRIKGVADNHSGEKNSDEANSDALRDIIKTKELLQYDHFIHTFNGRVTYELGLRLGLSLNLDEALAKDVPGALVVAIKDAVDP